MKLSEVDTSANLKVLVYGESGTGKTCFAAGFPTPMLILDFDGKANSAAMFYKDDKERLDQIEVRRRVLTSSEDPIMELSKDVKELQDMQKKGEYKYKTLVIDSLTTFSSAVLKHIVKTNPGIKRQMSKQGLQPCMQDYGILKREFERLIPGLLTLDMNIVMLGHIKTDKDETTGEILRGVNMDGSFGAALPIYFEEVYRSYVKDGKYMAQTQSDFRFKCRTQRGLPKDIAFEYGSLV